MCYSEAELDQIFSQKRRRCHICGERIKRCHYGKRGRSPSGRFKTTAWEVEHVNPLVNGGSERKTNLLPAHPRCNRTKHANSVSKCRKALKEKGHPVGSRITAGNTWKYCPSCRHDKAVHGNTKICPGCRHRLNNNPRKHGRKKNEAARDKKRITRTRSGRNMIYENEVNRRQESRCSSTRRAPATEELKGKIRRLFNEGLIYSEIASKLRLSDGQVFGLIRRMQVMGELPRRK